ncbi:unnamed protein product [Phytophthora fragariaefolia]|uniref:Unnamed protein product n=1 Tax=Phytophthora fragariaefolia TaxID=1490495 RepID=A0A9W6YCE8_9STRA|nr:unnamed protein product [Phytophthora fragariaefolia]
MPVPVKRINKFDALQVVARRTQVLRRPPSALDILVAIVTCSLFAFVPKPHRKKSIPPPSEHHSDSRAEGSISIQYRALDVDRCCLSISDVRAEASCSDSAEQGGERRER